MSFQALRGVLVAAVAMSLFAAGVPCAQAAPAPDPTSPLVDMELQVNPSSIIVFPTKSWNLRTGVNGHVMVSKARPGTVSVQLTCTIDSDWFVTIQPPNMLFSHIGDSNQPFDASILIPPNTHGPSEVTLTVHAVINLTGGRQIHDSQEVSVSLVTNADEFITNLGSIFTVQKPDTEWHGRMTLYNLLDKPMELHVTAMGKWAERLPDLDFSNPVHLEPFETRRVFFHAEIPEDTKPGDHRVGLALWTPGDDGHRIIVTSENVTLQVLRPYESDYESLQYLALLITFIVCSVVGAVTILWLFLTRHRWLRRDGSGAGGRAEAPRGHPEVPNAGEPT